MRVLVLAGTADARLLVARLTSCGVDVRASLAGRTASPRPLGAPTRIGGFGGVDGLVGHLRAEGITHLVDATHPYAATMPHQATVAAARAGVAHLRLLRPPWPRPADAVVEEVPDATAAARRLVELGSRRVLLALGRGDLTAFAVVPDTAFVVRSVDRPDLSAFQEAVAVTLEPPLTVTAERRLLDHHGIDAVVMRDAGGTATAAKVSAAAAAGVRLIVLARPPAPAAPTVPDVASAMAWLHSDR